MCWAKVAKCLVDTEHAGNDTLKSLIQRRAAVLAWSPPIAAVSSATVSSPAEPGFRMRYIKSQMCRRGTGSSHDILSLLHLGPATGACRRRYQYLQPALPAVRIAQGMDDATLRLCFFAHETPPMKYALTRQAAWRETPDGCLRGNSTTDESSLAPYSLEIY